METSNKSRVFEVRFSLLSLIALLLCWVGISLVAFYLGFLMGRTEQIDLNRQRHPVQETVGVLEDEPQVTFPDVLSDSEETQEPLPKAGPEKPITDVRKEPLAGMEAETGPSVPPPGIPPTKEASSEASLKMGTSKGRVLQVASFLEERRAEQLVSDLAKKGYRCFSSASVHPETKKAYYRVFVGPVSDQEEASRLKEELKRKEGFEDIVIRSAHP